MTVGDGEPTNRVGAGDLRVARSQMGRSGRSPRGRLGGVGEEGVLARVRATGTKSAQIGRMGGLRGPRKP